MVRGILAAGLRRHHQADRVALHVLGHRNAADHAAQLMISAPVETFRTSISSLVVVRLRMSWYSDFGRVADHQLEEEAVELGFGQGVGALLLDRVLGGHDAVGFLAA